MILMRTYPLEHPDIKIRSHMMHIAYYEISYPQSKDGTKIPDDVKDLYQDNIIWFCTPFTTEDDILKTLIHEITHWAQFLYLDARDISGSISTVQSYNSVREKHARDVSGQIYATRPILFDSEIKEIKRKKFIRRLIKPLYRAKIILCHYKINMNGGE
jgi:hypothetical protein